VFTVVIELFLPLFATFFFIPVLMVVLDAFICRKSVGDQYTDSFLDRDCHVWCWEAEHAMFVSFATLALFLYVPLVVITRPMWQFYQFCLHIQTLPRLLMIKTLF
jgi:hypothetical protein